MRLRSVSLSAVVALAGLVTAIPAGAQIVVVDNGPFSPTDARNITLAASADDFTLSAPQTFNAIRFWAADQVGNPLLLDAFSGTLSWYVHAHAVDRPGPAILASGSLSSGITLTDTGTNLGGSRIFQIDFPVPDTTFLPGTYWLRLKEGAPAAIGDSSSVFWILRSGQTGNNIRGDNNEVNPTTWPATSNADFAYQLRLNATIPEPGTLALLLVGTLTMGTGVRRRRRA